MTTARQRRYLLIFGATMSLRERAIVAAVRAYDGPIATIAPTARYVQVAGTGEVHAAIDRLGLPCVIKPSAFGGSLGVRLVRDRADAVGAWPGADPGSVPPRAHLDIADRLAAQIFQVAD